MELLSQDLPPVEIVGKQLIHRVLFALAVLIAALAGSLGGLFLVYSTDLPQVEELESYRPSSVTRCMTIKGG